MPQREALGLRITGSDRVAACIQSELNIHDVPLRPPMASMLAMTPVPATFLIRLEDPNNFIILPFLWICLCQ
jgi:hypothetical protein